MGDVGHAALYWFYDGYTQENMVIQANGYGNPLSALSGGIPLSTATWEQFLNGSGYIGSRDLNVPITETDRELLVYYGLWNVGAQYTALPGWGTFDGLPSNYPNDDWQSGSGEFRCDWFVNWATGQALGQYFNNDNVPVGSGVLGGGPYPVDMFNSTNAGPVSVTSPTATIAFSGQSNGSIVINFSELMSRGTLDPDWNNNVTLTGTVNGQNITYPLSSSNVSFQSSLLPSNISHGDEIFDYPEAVWDAKACQYRSVTQQSAQEMIITPAGGFVPGETLTLTISGAAEDSGGNAFLGKSFTLQVPSLQDGAKLLSQTIAANTQIAAGQAFTQSWTLQNTGTSTWTTGSTGYTLDRVPFNGSDPLGAGVKYLTLDNSVAPNSQYTFSVNLQRRRFPAPTKRIGKCMARIQVVGWERLLGLL